MDNFWSDELVTAYLNSSYAPERGESKEVNERCMDNFKRFKNKENSVLGKPLLSINNIAATIRMSL